MVKCSKKVTELKRTAYHEAGHAVMAYLLRRKFHFITIDHEKLDENTGGLVRLVHSSKLLKSVNCGGFGDRAQIERHISLALGGVAACELLVGPKSWHLSEDAEVCVRLAQSQCGDEEEADAYLHWLSLSVRNQLKLRHNWVCVCAVAKALMEQKTLSYRKTRKIIQTASDKYKSAVIHQF
jgi:ATP-dependent Zn protease